MVKYSMTRARRPLTRTLLLIPCLAAGLLLAPCGAQAQLAVTGPPTPASAALTVWFEHHIPAKFRAKGPFEVHPLTDSQMAAYLQDGESDGQPDQSSHSDDGEIDGIFEDDPPRITLLIPEAGSPDMFTFAHEYGHYVWFNLLSKDDRKRYDTLYKKQKAARHLVTRYAETNTEEGFAEAFSFYANEPPLLLRRDPASSQFLARWAAPLSPNDTRF